MKTPEEITTRSWPRYAVESVETRKRDIVIRIADWTRDKHEPAYDVEVYERGVYDYNQSKTFTTRSSNHTKRQARDRATAFAAEAFRRLVK